MNIFIEIKNKLLTYTLQNWEGPPTGYDVKQFRDNVKLVKLERLDRSPS